jgi:hypothetical protein
VLAVAALAAAAAIGSVSVRTTRDQLAVIEACDASAQGDIARALELTEGRTLSGETGRAAGECRCRALLARGERDACAELLRELTADPHWVPAPDLLELAVDARSRDVPESTALTELAQRLPPRGEAAAHGRAMLAQRHLRRGDPAAALRTLAGVPESSTGDARDLWFDTRLTSHAQGDDLEAARRTRAAWLAAGGEPATVRARYALAVSIAGLRDPEHDPIPLLERSLEETAGGGDRKLREGLAIRLVLTLANAERHADALAVYDRHREELGLAGLRRDELVRAERRGRLAGATAMERRGKLRLRVARPPTPATLLLSPDEAAAPDAPFESHSLPGSGELVVSRSEGDGPLRWVLRGTRGVIASGTLSPRAGEERTVWIETHGESLIPPGHVRSRERGDGRRRVALVLLDCGDWRIARYLRARGELPVLGALLRDGYRAVLESDPPLTAAALEALVWPGHRGGDSLLGLVHRMGVELAALASVGDNPFAALRLVLPERDDLFSAIGADDARAANLLLAHGGIRAGRHGEVSGPRGARSRVPIGPAARDLSATERERFPALANPGTQRDRLYVRTIAAELDATLELAHSGEHELLAVRIEPLDILTHANFGDAAADGQDDGEGLLFSVYRYIDARLGEIDAALDEDDVLIVMSDHGIRSAMEHSRDALFVAAGGSVPAGRAPGRPSFRGVARAIADLLGLENDWPDTGVAPFARRALAGADPSAEAPATR